MTTMNPLGTQPQNKFYVPTFTNIANSGTFANVQSFYVTQSIETGYICQVYTVFTFTPTAISCVYSISIPLGSAFAGAGKAAPAGGICFDVATQAVFGNFRTVDSGVGSIVTVDMTIGASVINLSNKVQLAFAYEVQ